MNIPLNLRQLLKHAEATKDAAAWEAFARNLLAERGLKPSPARAKKPAAKSARKAAAKVDPATLTLTECRALGIKPRRERFAGGEYVWVLVTFKNGQRILTGQYPRAGKPGDYSAAIGGARARLLLAWSGGVHMAERAKCPAVASARAITDPAELETLRDAAFRQRAAFETFLHAPYWEGDFPRSIHWVNRQHHAAPAPALERALRSYGGKPAWWRATYAPAD